MKFQALAKPGVALLLAAALGGSGCTNRPATTGSAGIADSAASAASSPPARPASGPAAN